MFIFLHFFTRFILGNLKDAFTAAAAVAVVAVGHSFTSLVLFYLTCICWNGKEV
mgnify:CR=1 FL=1